VFLNDNGGQIDYGAINVPLRGMKGTFLEGGVRVPMAMRWPGHVAEGSAFQAPVSSLDLLPTFLAAAGASPAEGKPLDGVDLMPYLAETNTARPHQRLFWRMGYTGAVRDGDWKLIRMPDRPPYLFNLADDPTEASNRFFEMPDKASELFRLLFDWEQQMIYPRWNTAPIWYKHNADRYDRPYRSEQPEGKQ
jgi:arylsulfatase A-like enzyme